MKEIKTIEPVQEINNKFNALIITSHICISIPINTNITLINGSNIACEYAQNILKN